MRVAINKRIFQLYCFCSLLSNCYKAFLWAGAISFLVKYRLFLLASVLSDVVLTLLFSFFLKNGHKVFDVINVCCCCCCLILLFVLTRFLNNYLSHQSIVSFFTPLSYLFWRLSFRSYTNCFENYLNFCVFLSVLHLVDNYAKIVDERGRKLMCIFCPRILHCKAFYM